MVSANKIEILRIAETVAQEKMIDKEIVLSALEEAIVKAAKNNYGEENEVVAEINQENGDILISRKMLVVEEVKNKFLEIHLKDAKKKMNLCTYCTFCPVSTDINQRNTNYRIVPIGKIFERR